MDAQATAPRILSGAPLRRVGCARTLCAIGPALDALFAPFEGRCHPLPGADELRLALSELGSNAVRHGGDPRPLAFLILPAVGGTAARFADPGPPLPAAVRAQLIGGPGPCPPPPEPTDLPEGGWGLFLVRACVDLIWITRAEDETHIDLLKEW